MPSSNHRFDFHFKIKWGLYCSGEDGIGAWSNWTEGSSPTTATLSLAYSCTLIPRFVNISVFHGQILSIGSWILQVHWFTWFDVWCSLEHFIISTTSTETRVKPMYATYAKPNFLDQIMKTMLFVYHIINSVDKVSFFWCGWFFWFGRWIGWLMARTYPQVQSQYLFS